MKIKMWICHSKPHVLVYIVSEHKGTVTEQRYEATQRCNRWSMCMAVSVSVVNRHILLVSTKGYIHP